MLLKLTEWRAFKIVEIEINKENLSTIEFSEKPKTSMELIEI